jgi:hypothetical protein
LIFTYFHNQGPTPPNNLTERRNNEIRVRGIRNLPIILERENTEKKKLKYPYNICKEYDPTHQCPRLVEEHNLLA